MALTLFGSKVQGFKGSGVRVQKFEGSTVRMVQQFSELVDL
jgi:hypothetical protein